MVSGNHLDQYFVQYVKYMLLQEVISNWTTQFMNYFIYLLFCIFFPATVLVKWYDCTRLIFMTKVHVQVEKTKTKQNKNIKFLRFWIFNVYSFVYSILISDKNDFVNNTPYISLRHKGFVCYYVYYVIRILKAFGTNICCGYLRGCQALLMFYILIIMFK